MRAFKRKIENGANLVLIREYKERKLNAYVTTYSFRLPITFPLASRDRHKTMAHSALEQELKLCTGHGYSPTEEEGNV